MKGFMSTLADDTPITPAIVFMFTVIAVTSLSLILLLCVIAKRLSSVSSNSSSFFNSSGFNIPFQYRYDEESFIHQDVENLSQEDKLKFERIKNYQIENPPLLKPLGHSYDATTVLIIKERGINAFQFENNQDDFLSSPRFVVEDRTDINFINNNDGSVSTSILNYSLPTKNRSVDTVYFEVKLFELFANNHVSIGLTTKPYPLFCLPGYANFSIGVESNGNLRINSPLPFSNAIILPNLQQSDVIGIGFKYNTGTIFVTHNGHKIMDIAKDIKLELYPAIGAIGNCKIQVNLGQSGFVFIEANVKKWGFVSNNFLINGNIGAPPIYDKSAGKNGDKVLDKGAELPPDYPEHEETFFGPPTVGSSSQNPFPSNVVQQFQQQVAQVSQAGTSKPPSKSKTPESDPPSYSGSSGSNSSQGEATPLLSKSSRNDNYKSIDQSGVPLLSDSFANDSNEPDRRLVILQDETIPEESESHIIIDSQDPELGTDVSAQNEQVEQPPNSPKVHEEPLTDTTNRNDPIGEPLPFDLSNSSDVNSDAKVAAVSKPIPISNVSKAVQNSRTSLDSTTPTSPLLGSSSSISKSLKKSTTASIAAQFRHPFSRSNSTQSIPLVESNSEPKVQYETPSTGDDVRSISTAISKLTGRHLRRTPQKKKKTLKKKKKSGKRSW